MRLTERVQNLLAEHLNAGDIAIDATAGNGYDTLGMAQAVGASGTVYAIDIQSAALESTRHRLDAAKHRASCEYRLGDHADVLQSLASRLNGKVRIITFNLGYLPGSDKIIQTNEASTLPALETATKLLCPKGYLLVTAYREHTGGATEAAAVEQWIKRLPSSQWTLETYEPSVSGDRIPPILYVIHRRTLT